jgi:hypothetical protein
MWEKIIDMTDIRRIKFGTSILRYSLDQNPLWTPPKNDKNYLVYKIFSFTEEGINLYQQEKTFMGRIGLSRKKLLHKSFKEMFEEKVWWYSL